MSRQTKSQAAEGKVLRVKEGYNPNSSSVGSAIPLYLGFAAGAGALTVLILNLQSAVGDMLRARKRAADEAVAEQDAPSDPESDGGQE